MIDHGQFVSLGMPAPIAREFCRQAYGKWVTERDGANERLLEAAGASPIVADELAFAITCGILQAGTLTTVSAWPRAVGDRLNQVLSELVADRDRRISETFNRSAA